MEVSTLGITLAWIGTGLMLGVTAAGAGLGFGMVCSAAIGVLKKKTVGFGPLMILSAIPSTNGIYGFVAFFLYMSKISEIAAASGGLTILQGATILGAGLAVAIGITVTCIYQAKISTDGIVAIGGGHKVFGNTLILAAYPEFFAILSLVGAILLLGVI